MNRVSAAGASAGWMLFLPSPAKLNVFLEVTARRSDGYHELETVMLRTRLADTMCFQVVREPVIRLQTSAATPGWLRDVFPLDERNLIVQVARALQERAGGKTGIVITVHKVIPPESGLAGGSSNAAPTLAALNDLWQLRLSDRELHEIAARHGSDINFLLSGARAAVCRGRGEIVEPIGLRHPLSFIVVRPRQGNRTGDVFRKLELPQTPRSSRDIVAALSGDSAVRLIDLCFNRLTEAACQLNPEMHELLRWLQQRADRPAFMSGSGAACCLMARDARDAHRLAATVQAATRLPVWLLHC